MKQLSRVLIAMSLVFIPTAVLAKSKPAKTMAKMEVHKIEVTNKLIDGKKVWLPADIELKAGETYELDLKNTLADPHGFEIPGLLEAQVVKGNETKVVKLTPKKAGTYPFKCQLHPAHVGGKVVVK